MHTRSIALALAGMALAAVPSSAEAQLGGGDCLTADAPPIDAPAHPLRFGITPLPAGSAGGAQGTPAPEDPDAAVAAAQRLRPGRRQLVMRMNRMFMSDGEAGVQRYAAIVDRYAGAGLDSELQVRYHPAPGQEGDMVAWERYVRTAVSILGKRPSVKAFSITNEANFSVSPNTSDGSYAGVRRAIVVGTLAARDELDGMGRPDVELGFSFAWRFVPSSDAAFWQELGTLGNDEFRSAVDYVGLQVYPHLVWPPAPLPGRSAGDETIEALTLLRNCYMPKAGLGDEVDVWVSENGYATNLGRSEASQADSLLSTVEAVHRYSGTLGVTDYRWFNLRDNRSQGVDLFDAVGLLRDDYSEKPSFALLRGLLDRLGADRPEETGPAANAPLPASARCRGRVASLIGTPGSDRLVGSAGPDVIAAGRGADRVKGRAGNDLICAGAGADVLRGGPGRDLLRGGPGKDRCPGSGRRDFVRSC